MLVVFWDISKTSIRFCFFRKISDQTRFVNQSIQIMISRIQDFFS